MYAAEPINLREHPSAARRLKIATLQISAGTFHADLYMGNSTVTDVTFGQNLFSIFSSWKVHTRSVGFESKNNNNLFLHEVYLQLTE